MVGICGGVWSKDPDVRLGDVIVSLPAGGEFSCKKSPLWQFLSVISI